LGTVFLHESGSLAWKFAKWLGFFSLAGSITFAWTRGVSCFPERTARFGALTGAIVGGCINLALWISAPTDRQPFSQHIDTTILDIFQWGFYGFLGGLAIEKGWGHRSAIRIALGVGVAGLIAAFFQVFYEDSMHEVWLEEFHAEIFNDPAHLRIFSDPNFWLYELSRQWLRALGWALFILLLPKSDDVLQRPEDRQLRRGDVSADAQNTLSGKEIRKVPAFKDQLETFITATIGVSAGLILWVASGTLSWNFVAWLKFLCSIGFALGLNFRYLDPFLERLGGAAQHTLDSRSKFRKVSLLSISATVPVAIFMQLNDKFMMDNPTGMALWLVGALSGGTITLAWARGSCCFPARAAELGALTGAIVPSLSIVGMHSYRIVRGLGNIDETIVIAIGAALEWGLYGLLGGLAIERSWKTWLPVRVAFGIMVAGLIIVAGLNVASIGVFKFVASAGALLDAETPPAWAQALRGISRVFLVATCWAWGLMLFPKSEDLLKVREERDGRAYFARSDQLTAEDRR
jgi:hypothetical protein